MNNYKIYSPKMNNNEDINDEMSQNKKLNYQNKNENNNDENKNQGAYPAFTNQIKRLFNEFAKEEGQNLNIPSAPAINFSEKNLDLLDGCCALFIFLGIILVCIILVVVFIVVGDNCLFVLPVPCLGIIVCFILICGNFITISPGEALVLTYYGKYVGTCKKCGFFWVRPCTDKSLISLKSTHYNGNMIKVNDKDGTPVLIGLVCIWRIKDTVKVTYCVRNYVDFMKGQTESAVRFIANKFAYDSNEENEPTLKSGNEDINTILKLELQRRTKIAGIEIEDARITEISYGSEIASMMLQKQAADAVISSKKKISKSAVQIIDDSIKELEQRNVCKFKDEEKSKLVANMMVVLNMDNGGNCIIKV